MSSFEHPGLLRSLTAYLFYQLKLVDATPNASLFHAQLKNIRVTIPCLSKTTSSACYKDMWTHRAELCKHESQGNQNHSIRQFTVPFRIVIANDT